MLGGGSRLVGNLREAAACTSEAIESKAACDGRERREPARIPIAAAAQPTRRVVAQVIDDDPPAAAPAQPAEPARAASAEPADESPEAAPPSEPAVVPSTDPVPSTDAPNHD